MTPGRATSRLLTVTIVKKELTPISCLSRRLPTGEDEDNNIYLYFTVSTLLPGIVYVVSRTGGGLT